MPELPEVQTIIQTLREGQQGSILHRKILTSDILWERTLEEPALDVYVQRISNQQITELTRRGKYLVFHLSRDFLLIHLRMSGDLRIEPDEGELLKHDRMVLHLDKNQRLVFNDTRKFGRVWLMSDPDVILGKLGPEPLDTTLTTEQFVDMLHCHKTRIKTLLMDQSFMAGLGNIYTDEALFRAKIHPCLPADQITVGQADVLLESIRWVLLEGIRNNGASIDWVYRGGNFQNRFQVYRKTGEPCKICQTPIERCVVNQRSTHYCPSCQKLGKPKGV